MRASTEDVAKEYIEVACWFFVVAACVFVGSFWNTNLRMFVMVYVSLGFITISSGLKMKSMNV
jgi:hypothetical protein